MGRRAKPTQLKLIENSRDRRPRALRDGEPRLPHADLFPPDWLTLAQLEIWKYGLASLPLNLLQAADRDLYLSWVFAVDLRNQAAQKLANSPLLIRTSTGNIVPSPFHRILNQQTMLLKSLCAEFGFSPAARTGIALADEHEEDPTDRFFE